MMASATKLGAAATVVVASIALLVWWRTQPVERPVGVAPGANADAVAGDEPSGIETRGSPAQRDVVATAATVPVDADTRTAIWKGRVVAAATGLALADASIALIDRDNAPPIGAVTADDSGHFELTGDVAEVERIRISHPGHAAIVTQVDNLMPGQVEDLGDLPLPPGRQIAGRLLHEDGSPFARRAVLRASLPSTRGRTWTSFGYGRTTTAADGSFVFEQPLPLGRGTFDLDDEEFELLDPAPVTVTATSPASLELTVRRRPVIAGTVVDSEGRPLEGIGLACLPLAPETRTGADGSFRLHKRFRNDRTTATVHVVDAPDHAPTKDGQQFAWGTRDARIVLPPAVSVPIEVVGDDGAPIEHFGMAVWRRGSEANGEVRHRGMHTNGRLLLERVAPGATLVRILPAEPQWMPSATLPIDAAAGLRVRLERRRPCRVEVVAGGRPVAGAEVALVFDRGRLPAHYPVRPPAQMPEFVDPCTTDRSDAGAFELVASARTDEQGVVELLCDPVAEGRALAIDDGDQPVHFVVAPQFPSDGRALHVELPQFGQIVGRVDLRGRLRFGVSVSFASEGRTDATTPQPDGSYRSPMLPEGPCEVALAFSEQGASVRVAGSERQVTVTRAAPVCVDFDLADHALASVSGRVDGGAAGRALAVDLLLDDGAPRAAIVASAEVDADGSFTIERLVPGTMRVALRRADAKANDVPGVLAATLTLTGGERGWVDVPAPRRLVVHLRRQDGSPVRDARVVGRCAGKQWPSFTMIMATTSDRIVLDPAPALPVDFRFVDGDWSEPVLPTDRAEAEATVVLPDPAQPRAR